MTDPLPRPEPVLDWARVVANWQKITAAVVGLFIAVGAAFVLAGVATTDQVKAWALVVGGIVASIGGLLAVILTVIGVQNTQKSAAILREKVTPLESPVNADGHALVDAAFYGRHAEHEAP